MTDLPFIAHYKDGDKLVPRRFATNAEAHAFRAMLVDGRLPPEPAKAEAPKPAPAATSPAVAVQKVEPPKAAAS